MFNAYMNVWCKSGDRKALSRVTQLLSFMEELGYEGGDTTVRVSMSISALGMICKH